MLNIDRVNLTIAVISMIAGVAGAYFAWRALPRRRREAARAVSEGAASQGLVSQGSASSGSPGEVTGGRDVFVSYASEDGHWVRALAVRLEQEGLKVFFDQWDISPGDAIAHELEEGIRGSTNAILVFSPVSVTKPWVRQEYAALVTFAVERGLRFIPVLYGEAEIPPFAASRKWVDFRGLTGAAYDQKVAELARAIRGHKPERV